MLEEERDKAKTIRDRMSGIAGGTQYGGYTGGLAGDSKYDSYNNKNYGGKPNNNKTYSESNKLGGLGEYGDYSYSKSTLEKYKNNDKNVNKSINITGTTTSPSIIPDVTGQGVPVESNKKPFEKIAPKLMKPQTKK